MCSDSTGSAVAGAPAADAPAFKPECVLKHPSAVTALAFSPNASLLATACYQDTQALEVYKEEIEQQVKQKTALGSGEQKDDKGGGSGAKAAAAAPEVKKKKDAKKGEK
eukprot:5377346-Prymnesium_polylepis.1